MNAVLSKLGVPPDIQAFFTTRDLNFFYGPDRESFTLSSHKVPVTRHLFIAGARTARQLVITSSAMEAIAYLTINAHLFPQLSQVAVIAIGNLAHTVQLEYIAGSWQKRKIILVFGRDLLGRLTDIRVAAGIRGKKVCLTYQNTMIYIRYGHVYYRFRQDEISLNRFEKAAALRTGIRTGKPKIFDTYLAQLKYDSEQ